MLAPAPDEDAGHRGPWASDGFRLGADPAPFLVQLDEMVAVTADRVGRHAVQRQGGLPLRAGIGSVSALVDGEHHEATATRVGGTVDLYCVRSLLRETDDVEESSQRRLRLAIGDAVLSATSSFSRFMAERRIRLDPNQVPVWQLQRAKAADSGER